MYSNYRLCIFKLYTTNLLLENEKKEEGSERIDRVQKKRCEEKYNEQIIGGKSRKIIKRRQNSADREVALFGEAT